MRKKSGFVAYVKFTNTLIINNIKRPPFQKKGGRNIDV